MTTTRGWAGRIAAIGIAVLAPSDSRADRVLLRGGAEVRGLVVADAARPDRVLVQTETAGAPLSFPKEQVTKVVAEPTPLREYFPRRDTAAQTAEAQFALGLWCEGQKLAGLSEVHYRRATELDKDHGPAHKKLGHVQHEGRWMTYDELKQAQGMVKHKGRWVSRQEFERLEAGAVAQAEQASWGARIGSIRKAILSGSPEHRDEAERELEAIRDPAAVRPLVQAFGDDGPDGRDRLDRALGAIPGPEATEALQARVLDEADPDIRGRALRELARRREPGTVGRFERALGSKDPVVVGRAAWALAGLKATSSVPKLVSALVRYEKKMVFAPVGGRPAGANGLSVGFTSVAPNSAGPGPAMNPGAVGSAPSVTGMSFGGTSGPRQVTRFLTIAHRNADVLEALTQLTGRDFGFDPPAWRRWLKSGPAPAAAPTRRVPQP